MKTNNKALRVHVLNIWVHGFRVRVITVQVLGKYMIMRYLDPQGRISGTPTGIDSPGNSTVGSSRRSDQGHGALIQKQNH